MMEYYIKPFLDLSDQKLWGFCNDIDKVDLAEIQSGVKECCDVLKGVKLQSNWSAKLSNLTINKGVSILEKNGQFIAEISTLELYEMLKNYVDASLAYQIKMQSK